MVGRDRSVEEKNQEWNEEECEASPRAGAPPTVGGPPHSTTACSRPTAAPDLLGSASRGVQRPGRTAIVEGANVLSLLHEPWDVSSAAGVSARHSTIGPPWERPRRTTSADRSAAAFRADRTDPVRTAAPGCRGDYGEMAPEDCLWSIVFSARSAFWLVGSSSSDFL